MWLVTDPGLSSLKMTSDKSVSCLRSPYLWLLAFIAEFRIDEPDWWRLWLPPVVVTCAPYSSPCCELPSVSLSL